MVVPCPVCGVGRDVHPKYAGTAEQTRCLPCWNNSRRGRPFNDDWVAHNQTVDEMAVDRLIAGHPPQNTTPAERREAIVELTRRGWSAKRIGLWIGIAERSVTRLRSASRQAA